MKTKRKFLALVLVVLMTMALAIPAFADEATTGTITITNAVSGKTYAAYKIFDLAAGYSVGDNVYTWNGNLSDLPDGYATYFTFTEGTDGMYTVTATDAAKDGNGELVSDAIAILAGMKGTAAKSVEATSTTVTMDGLAVGYYYVTSTQGSAVVVTTTKPNATIADKNVSPSWDNEPDEPGEGEDPNPGKVIIDCNEDHSHTDACKKVVNSVNLGDTVKFDIGITATNYDLDKLITYYYIIDTLPDGMKFNNDIAVTIDGNSATLNDDYTVNTDLDETTNNADATFIVSIKWAELNEEEDDLESIYDSSMFHEIHVTYSATVKDSAVIGATGNVNTANFTYDTDDTAPGEDPEDPTPDPDPDPDDDNEKKTTTYVYSLGIFKHNAANEKLPGAKFELYTEEACTNKVTFYSLTENAVGSYMKKIDGDATKYTYTEFTTDDDGLIELIGLEAGEYWLKETVAPNGYNLMSDTPKITISEVDGDETTDHTYTKSIAYEAKVLNNKGTELPATGGIGTTLFITFGMIAMLCTGVFLVTNKRISKETF